MSADTIATLAAAAVIIGFLWSLHRDVRGLDRDVRSLSERMARIEGAFESLRGSVSRIEDVLYTRPMLGVVDPKLPSPGIPRPPASHG